MIETWSRLEIRKALQPPNSRPLRRWIARATRCLSGRIINVGSGSDDTEYGRLTVRVDAFAPQPTVRADVGRALPFANDAFDGAVCTEVLEHVPDGRALLVEIHRVLKPGAPLILTVPFVFPYHPDPRDQHRWTPAGLRDDLTRLGFNVEFVSGIGGRAMGVWLMVESLHPALKFGMRVFLLPFRSLVITRRPRNGVWSPWSLHVVAVARTRADNPAPVEADS